MNIQLIIGIILVILIIFFTYKKNNEYFNNNESIMNIAKLYADASGTAYFNKISAQDASFNNISVKNVNNKARYVRIGNDLSGSITLSKYWNVTSVKIFDMSGNNISDGKSVTIVAGAPWKNSSGVPVGNDANIITKEKPTFVNSTYHYQYLYQGGEGGNALKIDLGKEYKISEIIIWGRAYPTWYQRLNNTSIQLIAEDGITVNKTLYSGTWETLSKEFYL